MKDEASLVLGGGVRDVNERSNVVSGAANIRNTIDNACMMLMIII